MTITKLLCKYFDADEKGYVTIGDLATEIISVAILIISGAAATFIIGSAYLRGAWLIYNGSQTLDEWYTISEQVYVVIFAVPSMLAVVAIVIYITLKLASIRVVTCERKEGDETP